MQNQRREFIKKAGLGVGGAMLASFTGTASAKEACDVIKQNIEQSKSRRHIFNMCNYAAPAIPIVRIGYIGVGSRGGGAVTRVLNIKGNEVRALCDLRESAVKANQKKLTDKGLRKAKEYYGDDYAWKKLCEQPDLDLIYIATPWAWHAQMAVYAMECGKHVAVEVPAVLTLDEAWQIVATSERTRKHCFQLENMVYDPFEMAILCMTQTGMLGELVHGEGEYIHDTLKDAFGQPVKDDPKEKQIWRYKEQLKHGNLYPTHGLGPVSQAFNINRGDRFDYMSSVSTFDFSMGKRAEELAEKNPYYKKFVGLPYRGNTNSSIIKTVKGKTIVVQHDAASPRPYSRSYILSGTKGFVQKYPLPGKVALGHKFMSQKETDELIEKYTPDTVKLIRKAVEIVGGHGGADFVMDYRLIDCLRNGLAMDMDVYDAASWSAVTPLSIWSCANRSNSIDFPDFTCGAWSSNKPVDMSLRGGGSTEVDAKLKQ